MCNFSKDHESETSVAWELNNWVLIVYLRNEIKKWLKSEVD